jgi:thioredoxin 1
MMIDHLSDTTFEHVVLLSAEPVLVSFIGTECGPWNAMSWALEQVAKHMHGQLKVAKLDVTRSPGLRARYEIHGLPTLILFNQGEPVARRLGAVARTEDLEAWIKASIAI